MKIRQAGRLAATFTLAAGLALGAAACGGDSPTDPTTEKTKSEIPADPKEAVIAAITSISDDTYSMDITMGELLTMSAQSDPANSAMTMAMSASDTEMGGDFGMEMISIGNDVWVKMNGLFAELLPGAADYWLHTTTEDEDLDNIAQLDPVEILAELNSSVKEVTATGDNTYDVVLDSKIFEGDVPDDVTEIAATVTLTDDGKLASMEMTIPEAVDGEDQVMVITFSGYGEPVNVEAPPADQVKEMSEVMNGGF